MALAQPNIFTEEDHYKLPENVRAELIDGQIYLQAAPSRVHQRLLGDLFTDKGCTGVPDWIMEIVSPSNPGHEYVRKLNLYLDAGVREYWIVDPITRTVVVYHLMEPDFEMDTYTFQDEIKVGIYDDLRIDLKELAL